MDILRKTILFTGLFICSLIASAQITKPSLSPRIKTEQQVGLANVKLEYGQPNKQDRVIFGQLIPYGKVWRTGANSSTKISFDREVSLSGNKIPAGTYGLYSIPEKNEWTIIIHKNEKLWGAGNYDANNDLLRFKVPVQKLENKLETLSIHFESFHANGGDLVINWEQTKIVIPLFVDSDAAIFQEINEKVVNSKGEISAQTYFDAAQFYYHKDKELDQAALWFEKAIELRPTAFWFVYYRAELAYHLNDVKLAKSFVQKSLEMAKQSKAGDYGYIAKCQLLLEKLK